MHALRRQRLDLLYLRGHLVQIALRAVWERLHPHLSVGPLPDASPWVPLLRHVLRQLGDLHLRRPDHLYLSHGAHQVWDVLLLRL